ncbi:helix-turn-helix transcriptional regulator [Gottschalkiaceae bacterium SANA]|nr:helix-turn-helix transcriptional regulator [Gottschalkiaceae bacterium SANA]
MPEKLQNQIRQIRRGQTNLTQAQLAERVGCTRQTIVALEQERYNPSLILAMKIAGVLHVTLEKLFVLSEEDSFPSK